MCVPRRLQRLWEYWKEVQHRKAEKESGQFLHFYSTQKCFKNKNVSFFAFLNHPKKFLEHWTQFKLKSFVMPFIARIMVNKHGRDGSRCPILTIWDLNSIVHILSILAFKQSDRDLDQSRWGISIHLAHAWWIFSKFGKKDLLHFTAHRNTAFGHFYSIPKRIFGTSCGL